MVPSPDPDDDNSGLSPASAPASDPSTPRRVEPCRAPAAPAMGCWPQWCELKPWSTPRSEALCHGDVCPVIMPVQRSVRGHRCEQAICPFYRRRRTPSRRGLSCFALPFFFSTLFLLPVDAACLKSHPRLTVPAHLLSCVPFLAGLTHPNYGFPIKKVTVFRGTVFLFHFVASTNYLFAILRICMRMVWTGLCILTRACLCLYACVCVCVRARYVSGGGVTRSRLVERNKKKQADIRRRTPPLFHAIFLGGGVQFACMFYLTYTS